MKWEKSIQRLEKRADVFMEWGYFKNGFRWIMVGGFMLIVILQALVMVATLDALNQVEEETQMCVNVDPNVILERVTGEVNQCVGPVALENKLFRLLDIPIWIQKQQGELFNYIRK